MVLIRFLSRHANSKTVYTTDQDRVTDTGLQFGNSVFLIALPLVICR